MSARPAPARSVSAAEAGAAAPHMATTTIKSATPARRTAKHDAERRLATRRLCSAAHALGQLAGAAADQDLAQPAFDRPADRHAEHAARVALQPVRHSRAAVAHVLELPGADQRL